MLAPFPRVRIGDVACVVLQRCPDLRRRKHHVLEECRHDADHGVEVVVESDLAADDGAVRTEAAAPQMIAEDGYAGTVDLILGLLKGPPERRRHAEYPRPIPTHALPVQPF